MTNAAERITEAIVQSAIRQRTATAIVAGQQAAINALREYSLAYTRCSKCTWFAYGSDWQILVLVIRRDCS